MDGESDGFRRRGSDVTIYPWARILGRQAITLGAHVVIDDFVFIGVHAELVIGNHVHVACHASITGGGRCILHDFCGISSGARILTGSDDFSGGGLTGPTISAEFRAVQRREVIVESHALVGANCVILPGLRIGEGAAVGAGSVVTHDLPPWGVYAGVPARPLGQRVRAEVLRQEEQWYRLHGRSDPSYRSMPASEAA